MRRWWLKVLPDRFFPFWQGQVLALACVCGASFLRLALAPFLDRHAPFITFFPVLLIASVWGGPWSGLSVLILSATVVSLAWLPRGWNWGLTASSPLLLIAFVVCGALLIAIALLLRAVVNAHQAEEKRATVLAQEMQHRVRNLLALVAAISSQTARGATTIAAHQALFTARLQALARAQDLAVQCPPAPMELRALLERVLEPFGIERFGLAGPEAVVTDGTSASLALLIHELGTNAIKHGALSVAEGRVEIAWAAVGRRVELEWREVGGPPVAAPLKAGFGTRLMLAAFPSEVGDARMTFAPEGVRCVMRF